MAKSSRSSKRNPQKLPADPIQQVAALLKREKKKIVFSESCTGGLVAASLTRIPGISEFLCGSAVVYRNRTKQAWLGIPAELLDDPAAGPVSRIVTERLAEEILRHTPEADLGVAVTGHLGPGAPRKLDGKVFIAVAERTGDEILVADVQEKTLPAPRRGQAPSRSLRQKQAAKLVFRAVSQVLGYESHG